MTAHEQALIIKGYLTALNAPSHILAGIDIILNEVAQSDGNISVKIPVQGHIDSLISQIISKRENIALHVPQAIDVYKKEENLNTPEPICSESEHKKEERASGRRKLTDDDKRRIVYLRENEKKRWSEIAQTIGCKKETAYSWYANHNSIGDLQKWRAPKSNIKTHYAGSPPEKKGFIDIPADKIIADHDDYVGQRDPGQELTDKDWPDIQRMLQKGKNIRTLATDYNVDRTVMDVFVDKHLLADARKKDATSRGPRPLKLDDIEPLEETDF